MENSPMLTILSDEEVKNRLKNFSASIQYVILDEHTTVQNLRNQLITSYETPWCDPIYLNIADPFVSEDHCSKLFLYENGILKHIMLFKSNGKKTISVLNHCFSICVKNIDIISTIFFKTSNNVKKIVFTFADVNINMKFPKLILEKVSEDIVIELPETMDTYMKSLGPNTRKHAKKGQKSILQDHPDFKISFHEGENISREQVSSIIELNKSRMQHKGKICNYGDAYCDILFRYTSVIRGILCLCTIDERIVSGSICWAFKEHVYANVLAHDNTYNKYGLGNITLVNTIQYMIENNLKYLHLLWGRGEYKYRFLGKERLLHNVMVFRKKSANYFVNRIIVSIRSLINTTRERLKENVRLRNLYKKLRNL